MLQIKKYIVSIMKANCYLIKDVDSGLGVIVDPGKPSVKLDQDIKECNEIKYILLTHGHFDHISAAIRYKNLTNAKIVIGYDEQEFTKNIELNLAGRFRRTILEDFDADIFVNDGDKLNFADSYINVISTPGHTKGGVCYLIQNLLFSGDTLMKDDIGRYDLPTGDENQLKLSLEKIFKIEGDCVVYPGHGLDTTIEHERKNFKLR